MKREELIQRLMVTFLNEVQEHSRALERDLLALEKITEPTARGELFKTLFRTAHSLKGASRSVNVGSIETACHYLEELFAAIRECRRNPDRPLIELLLATADAIAETGQKLKQGDEATATPLEELLPRLATAISSAPPVSVIPKPEGPVSTMQPPHEAGRGAEGQADRSPQDGVFVRVPAERIESLLIQSGELLVARYRTATRTEDLAALQELIKRSRAEWSRLERRLAPIMSGAKASSSASSNFANQPAVQGFARGGLAQTLLHHRNMLLRLERGLQQLGTDLAQDGRAIENAITPLYAEVRRARMQPFMHACEGLERIVRDLSTSGGKAAKLVIKGGDIEADRAILDGLRDALRHLVRNAIDHGIEPQAERRAADKPEAGLITIVATVRGDSVLVSVADDGRGLNLEAIRDQLQKKGLPEPENERELIRQIFLPRFSTSATVTQVSGRGVGLDVVKTAVEAMRGAVDVSHTAGKGTTFTIALPLTLKTIRAVLVMCGEQIFALDSASVRRVVRFSSEDIRSVEGRAMLLSRSGPIPALDLADWLGILARPERHAAAKIPAVVLSAGSELAVVVDEVLAERELLVRGLGPRLSGNRNYTGGTILPDGRVALVLNGASLLGAASKHRPKRDFAPAVRHHQPSSKRRLLVVDDSVTTRILEKSILEAAGYEVLVASDGAEAWQMLQTRGADLIVTDVEMPLMDGFALTECIRASMRFKDLPVVLVTARETPQDKARGLQVGADAYLVKSAFDQRQLLEVVAQIL